MLTISKTVTFEVLQCWSCGCSFAVDENLYRCKKENNKSLHCPNGCSLSLGPSRVEIVKKEMAEELARVKRDKEHIEAIAHDAKRRANSAERSLVATKGVVTKIKKRVSHGVCPCCNRTFTDLQRHMKAKHPDFADSGTETVDGKA